MDFKEIAKIKTSDKVHVILSSATKDGELTGVNICKYVETPKFTGYTKGTLIPKEHLKTIAEELLKVANDGKDI